MRNATAVDDGVAYRIFHSRHLTTRRGEVTVFSLSPLLATAGFRRMLYLSHRFVFVSADSSYAAII